MINIVGISVRSISQNAFTLFVNFMAYQILTVSLLICLGLIIIGGLNMSGGNLNLEFIFGLSFVDQLGIQDNATYTTEDFIRIVTILAFPVMIVGEIAHWLIARKMHVDFQTVISIMMGVSAITLMFLFAFISTYSPVAPVGAASTRVVLVILYVAALIPFLAYEGIHYLLQKVYHSDYTHVL